MLIFLDIDGVLNRHEWNAKAGSNLIERENVGNLNFILEETGANLVISSAWRYIIHRGEASITGFDWLLRSHGVHGQRIVGYTRPDTLVETPHYDGFRHNYWPVLPNERGTQIREWLTLYSPNEKYIVLDDGGYEPVKKVWTDLGITPNGHPVVWTNPKTGLTLEDSYLAVDLLKSWKNKWPDSPLRGTYAS